MNRQSLRYYEFGPFRLNVTERLLQKSDEVVPLTPKLIDTLVVLVENGGHVMTKEGLMQMLWPDSFVEESSLTQNISLLRKALADDGSRQHYIETIPKRGYRFVADVREFNGEDEMLIQERTSTQVLIEEQLLHDSEEPVSPQATPAKAIQRKATNIQRTNSRAYFAAIAGSVVLLSLGTFYWFHQNKSASVGFAPKSIAVLPFRTIGSQAETELIGLGMADAVILKLNRLNQMRVLPISSVYKYTSREKDALSIGKDLGVEAVLDGTVQRDGNAVRVTAYLLNLKDGTTVWSEKFDADYTNIFALQDSIAEVIATALPPEIRSLDKNLLASRTTKNPEAHQAYLMGLYFWNRRTKDNLAKAINYLEQAVEKDPNFALAYALLADCHYLASKDTFETISSDESMRKANGAATRALELDDSVAEAHIAKAGISFTELNYDEADREFRRGLDLNPNYAVGHLRYGYFLFAESKLEAALYQMKQAQQLDPVSPTSNTALGYMLFMSRDPDGAIQCYQKALELQSDYLVARVNLGLAYLQKRRFDEAIAEFEKLKETDPLRAVRRQAMAYGLSGRLKEARRMLAELFRFQDHEKIEQLDYAILYSSIGEKDTAFQWLEKVPVTRFTAARLKFSPELDSLRVDPRFGEFLKRHKVD